MPWEQVWVTNPADETMPVLETYPEGFEEFGGWGSFKTARRSIQVLLDAQKRGEKLDYREFYHCRYCKGWIEGKPYQYHESNLGPLCGRRGEVSSCIRCGHEIGFSGMVS